MRISPANRGADASLAQQLPQAMCPPFAGDELLIVAQRDQPALAAKRAHFADVIHVDERVAMDALEAGAAQPLLDYLQRLGRQVLSPDGDDPHQVALGLKGEDLSRIEEKILLADFADDLPRSRPWSGRRDFLKLRQLVCRLAAGDRSEERRGGNECIILWVQ